MDGEAACGVTQTRAGRKVHSSVIKDQLIARMIKSQTDAKPDRRPDLAAAKGRSGGPGVL